MTFCRLCQERTYIGDAHPCCERWMGHHGHMRYIACDASRAFKRRPVPPAIQPDDTDDDVERIEWRGLTIRQQFPWTRPKEAA